MATERTLLVPLPAEPSDKPSAYSLSPREKFLILLSCQTAVLFGAIDMTITAVLLQPIAASFHASHESSWLGTSFLLANITFTPLYGRLCDILGRRAANASAIGLFALGTALCAVSPSMGWLIAARFIAGAGGGGMMTTSTVIVADLFPLKQRGLVGAISTGVWAIGGALGAPIGGAIADAFGWRAAFVFQVPILVACLLSGVSRITYPVASDRKESLREKLRRIDLAGCSNIFLGGGSALVALSLRNNEQLEWSNKWLILFTALAPLFFCLFIFIETRAIEPILPFKVLSHRTPFLACCVTIAVALCNFGIMYNFPIWFLSVRGTSVARAGAHLLPTSIGNFLGGISAGIVMHKTGKYRVPNAFAGFAPVVATLLIANLTRESNAAARSLDILPMGYGFGYILNTSFVALMASVPQSDVPAVTGVLWLFRTTGQVVGVASTAAILQSILTSELSSRITGHGASKIIKSIREDSSRITTFPPSIQLAARTSYAIALQRVFLFCASFAFVAWVSIISIRQVSLEQAPGTTVVEEVEEEVLGEEPYFRAESESAFVIRP